MNNEKHAMTMEATAMPARFCPLKHHDEMQFISSWSWSWSWTATAASKAVRRSVSTLVS